MENEKKKRGGCGMFAIIGIAGLFLIGLALAIQKGNSDEVKQTETAFDALHYRDMDMEALKSELGEPDKDEEWLYNDMYKIHTLTYGKRDFDYVSTTDRGYVLTRIHDYNEYEVSEISVNVLAKLFGCDTVLNSGNDYNVRIEFTSDNIDFKCFYTDLTVTETIMDYYGGVF